MLGSRRNLTAMAAVLAVGGLSAGAWAGLDAAGQIDGLYTAPPAPEYAAIPPAPRATEAWEWGSQSLAAAPAAGTIWGREVGRDERAFFDTGAAVSEEEPVRVHRASVEPADVAEPAPLPDLDAEEPVDGYVEAPAAAEEERTPQPVG